MNVKVLCPHGAHSRPAMCASGRREKDPARVCSIHETELAQSIPWLHVKRCRSYVLTLTAHLVNGRYGEELRDLDQPLKIEHDWNLTSKMASFETLIITCKSEHSTRE